MSSTTTHSRAIAIAAGTTSDCPPEIVSVECWPVPTPHKYHAHTHTHTFHEPTYLGRQLLNALYQYLELCACVLVCVCLINIDQIHFRFFQFSLLLYFVPIKMHRSNWLGFDVAAATDFHMRINWREKNKIKCHWNYGCLSWNANPIICNWMRAQHNYPPVHRWNDVSQDCVRRLTANIAMQRTNVEKCWEWKVKYEKKRSGKTTNRAARESGRWQ